MGTIDPPGSSPTAEANNDPSATKEDQHDPEDGGDERSEGAFNPETGEINWDCPCLGGMAHGPCGQQFREAFSCFVFSSEEPKGIDCIELFKNMQDCFRAHPDVYGEEIADEDDNPSDRSTEADRSEPSTSIDTLQTSPGPHPPVDNTNDATSRVEGR